MLITITKEEQLEFLKQYWERIKKRTDTFFNWVNDRNLIDQVWNSDSKVSYERLYYSTLWEVLVTWKLKWKVSTSYNEDYDILLQNKIKIDVKTLVTIKSDNLERLKNYNFYLLASQIEHKRDIVFVPLWYWEWQNINFIYNPKFTTEYIINNFNKVKSGPENTNFSNSNKENYIIPVKSLLED